MTELREKINNMVEDYQECLILAKSVETPEVYEGTTATAEDIREGKTAYVNGEKVTGTLEVNNAEIKATINVPALLNIQTAFECRKAIETIDLSEEDLSTATNFKSAFSDFSVMKKVALPEKLTAKNASLGSMFSYCNLLEEINYFEIPNVKTSYYLQNMFSNCPNLTDESLNNILLTCSTATGYPASQKTLKHIGLNSTQATKCQTLSNYQAFLDAGWTTGY